MNSMRSRGLWLLVLGALTGLLALPALTAVALAGAPDRSGGISTALAAPYAAVVEAVRGVSGDGVIRGTAQYENEAVISGAKESQASALFPRSAGDGEAFYKVRAGAIAPSHFAGSEDRGAVAVRYVVAREQAGETRVTIDAVFVEDSHHGRHLSQGFVERAELEEIAKLLGDSGALGKEPERKSGELAQAKPSATAEPDRPVPAVAEGHSMGQGRTYAGGEGDLKKALQDLGAFDDAPLPALEGFATMQTDGVAPYDRPYYRFRVAFEAAGPGRTKIRMEAVVTARFIDPAG